MGEQQVPAETVQPGSAPESTARPTGPSAGERPDEASHPATVTEHLDEADPIATERPDEAGRAVVARARAGVAGAAVPPPADDLPDTPAAATTYRASAPAKPVPAPRAAAAQARASAAVPGLSRVSSDEIAAAAVARAGGANIYRAGPVNPEPPEPAQPPDPAQPPAPPAPEPEPAPTPVPGPTPPSPAPPVPEPEPPFRPMPPLPTPPPPGPTPPGPVPPAPGPPVPPPAPPVPPPPPPPGPMPAPPFPPPPATGSTAGGPLTAGPMARASAPVSAPSARASAAVSAPVVPAPALTNWPASSSSNDHRTGPTGRDGGPAQPAGGPPAGPADQGGPDLAGTAYGGSDGPGFTTVSFPQGNHVENSGSLTGHILAQGWAEDAPATRSSNTRVVIVLAVALGLLIAISLLVVFLADNVLSGLTGSS
ncbi:hypothetical protein ABZ570_16005 [Micromonospora sp. NPDC007271]|uniref:hypothetical protein n=1 Tax=Micromonospora sp. NPDC007271 TaxID=3154587 RepID=UPI0034005118